MSTLRFDKEAARRLEKFYATRDVRAQRAATMDKLKIAAGEKVIDIGCGPGFLCEDIARRTGPDGAVLGMDLSADLIDLCRSRNPPDWLRYAVGDATDLPAADESFDVAVSTQVLEYIQGTDTALSEMFRVLKPAGRGIVVATDWECVAWHSDEPDRMARVMRAFEAHCAHPTLPRTLAPALHKVGFKLEEVSLFPLVNMTFEPEAYSHGISKLIREFILRGHYMCRAEAEAWHAELQSLAEEGRYYFSSGRMMFTVRKPA